MHPVQCGLWRDRVQSLSPCCAVTWDHPDMASGLKRIADHLGHSGASEKQSRPEEVLKKKKKVK